MKFEKNLEWLKEADEENLLEDDELDSVDEELNEGLYVDPSNYGNYDDLVDVVDKKGNAQKMTKATYDKNKGSDEFKDAEPKEEPNDNQDTYDDYYGGYDDYYGGYDDYYGGYDDTDNMIANVNYANHPDYYKAYKSFVNNYLDSSNPAYKTIYRTANGEYDPSELRQSERDAIADEVERLKHSNVASSIFYNRLKQAADYRNDRYDDYYGGSSRYDDYYGGSNSYDDYYGGSSSSGSYDDYYGGY